MSDLSFHRRRQHGGARAIKRATPADLAFEAVRALALIEASEPELRSNPFFSACRDAATARLAAALAAPERVQP